MNDQTAVPRAQAFTPEGVEKVGVEGVEGSQNSQRSQAPQAPQASGEATGEPVLAFCQQCGRALTASTRRSVGSGVFCEPCAAAGAATGGWTPVNPGAPHPSAAAATDAGYAFSAPYPAVPTDARASGDPNPILAGFLGLIPGVGAMYNGQYPKGAVHLIVFVVLVSLADNLNWVIWWLVWGWIFYQAFDAYHTALARRDGLSLPDPFGWNGLGERMGFGRNWPPPTTTAAGAPPPPGTGPASPPYPSPPSNPGTGAAAANSVAPTAPTAPTPPAASYPSASAFATGAGSFAPSPFRPDIPSPPPSSYAAAAGQRYAPYTPTYTGATATVSPAVLASSRRFPVGAALLIGLGLLFLLGNLLPSWQLEGRWLVPILLGALAAWIGVQRLLALRDTAAALSGSRGWPSINRIAGALLGPALLATVAVLLALQAAEVLPLRHSWPALLIVWGALQLGERAPVLPSSAAVSPSPEQTSRPTADPQ